MYKVLFCFIFFSLSLSCFMQIRAQETDISILDKIRYDQASIKGSSLDQKAIKEYKNDPNYNYTELEPEDNWFSRLKRKIATVWQSFLKWLTGSKEATGIFAFFLKIVPYLLLVGLLALLTWLFLKIDNTRTIINSNTKNVFISDDEEIIKTQDIQALIDQALKEKNYRLAIRYYYLLTLQQLSSKGLIDWQVQKTNHEYLYEIKNSDLREQFDTLTDLYDYIWYGNFEVDHSAFAKAQHAFHKISSEI